MFAPLSTSIDVAVDGLLVVEFEVVVIVSIPVEFRFASVSVTEIVIVLPGENVPPKVTD